MLKLLLLAALISVIFVAHTHIIKLLTRSMVKLAGQPDPIIRPHDLENMIHEWSSEKAACVGPDKVDPDNIMIRRYGKKRVRPVKCNLQKPLTHIDQTTGEVTASPGSRCFYSLITMKNGSDEILVYSQPKRLIPGKGVQLSMQVNTVNTTCFVP